MVVYQYLIQYGKLRWVLMRLVSAIRPLLVGALSPVLSSDIMPHAWRVRFGHCLVNWPQHLSMRRHLGLSSVARIKIAHICPKVGISFIDADGHEKASAVVEIADTPSRRARGLMHRDNLPDGEGMFFDKAGSYWMKNVAFPLDLVYTDPAGVVLEKIAMVPPVFGYARIYQCKTAAAHAIELPAGWFERQQLCVGDRVQVKD